MKKRHYEKKLGRLSKEENKTNNEKSIIKSNDSKKKVMTQWKD